MRSTIIAPKERLSTRQGDVKVEKHVKTLLYCSLLEFLINSQAKKMDREIEYKCSLDIFGSIMLDVDMVRNVLQSRYDCQNLFEKCARKEEIS